MFDGYIKVKNFVPRLPHYHARSLLYVGGKCLPKENLHAALREFLLILLEKEARKKFWRIIIKQELLYGIEGSVESSNTCWNVNISVIAFACSSEIGASYMMPRDKLHTQTTKYTIFLFESRQTTLYTHVLHVYINFQHKKKTFKKLPNLQALYISL